MSNPQMSYWKRFQLAVFERLRDHAVRCALCEGPGASLPAGSVRVSSDCQDGIVLLTEWFIAKHEAEREPTRPGVTPCRGSRP